MGDYDIILASNSKQRKDLLKYIFNEFKIIPAKIDERKLEKDFLDSNLCQDLVNYVKNYLMKNVNM